MNTSIPSELMKIGLHEREAKVYTALLELGEASVLSIAKKSGIQRTYVYDILDALKKRGLVSHFEKHGRKVYQPESPHTIDRMLKERASSFSALLPELLSIYNLAPDKPKVRFYEGKEGALAVYDEMMNEPWYDNIGQTDTFTHVMGEEYSRELGARIAKNRIRTRELFTQPTLPLSHTEYYDNSLQEIRFLPPGISITTDLCISETKAYFISLENDMHTVIIESSGIVKTLRMMFELLWQMSEPNKKTGA